MAENLGLICAATVEEAHRQIATRHEPGKLVLEGY
jgi:hypothetical protein